MMSYIYLLHFSQPIAPGRHTCQHYIGFAADLAARIQSHATGHGARLVTVARERGISFEVMRVWRGSRRDERRLKNRKNAPALCPHCRQQPEPVCYLPELTPAEIEEALLPF